AAAMRRTVFGSWTKFWPSFFVGVRSSCAASSRMRAGPSSVGMERAYPGVGRSTGRASVPGAVHVDRGRVHLRGELREVRAELGGDAAQRVRHEVRRVAAAAVRLRGE